MPLTSELVPWRIKTIPGMNTKMENFELQSNWVEIAQNCLFEEEIGTVVKRQPISYFNYGNKIGIDPIVGSYRFYTSGGTAKFIVTAGNGVYVGDDSTGACTLIRSLGSTGKRCSFITYKDLMMGFNGYDNPFVYDGSSDNITWELGSCKAKVGTGTGISRTTISYAITFDTSDAIVNGAVSNTIVSTSNQSIELTNIPLGPVGTAYRRIYRKSSETSGYRLLYQIDDNTTTTYTDTSNNASAGTVMPAVTDDIPMGAFPVMFRERLFLSGDPNSPNKIRYSYPYLPHILLQTTGPDELDVSPDDNDEITGIGVYGGMMICFKKNTIRRMYVAGPDSSWYAEDPLVFSGTPAPWSITNTPNGIVFLGWDHWYLFTGGTVELFIDEFDNAEILPSRYSETVGFYHDGHMLAAYTDTVLATQYHNRVMRYNIKRQKLSYDTILANCFTAKRGGDETGELYYGSSMEGYIFKGSNEELTYRLNTKSQCELGGASDVFIGGTESSPYLEIGSAVSAQTIPVDTCVFWDSEIGSPGSGWTEIDGGGRLIKIHTTTGTLAGTAIHTHAVTGTLDLSGVSSSDGGDSESDNFGGDHTHTVSGTTSAGTVPYSAKAWLAYNEYKIDDFVIYEGVLYKCNTAHTSAVDFTTDVSKWTADTTEELYPRWVKYRIFKKNNTTTEYEFPNGSIIMYDQPSAPEGWQVIDCAGYYVRIDDVDLANVTASNHAHLMKFNCAITAGSQTGGHPEGAPFHPAPNHVHPVVGSLENKTMDDWELDYASFRFIKKIGESSTWDGVSNYAYVLFASTTAASNGWTDVTATYTGKYLKIGDSIPEVISAWVTSTAYGVGDLVTSGGNIYVCSVEHTSGTFVTDKAAGKWVDDSIHTHTIYSGMSGDQSLSNSSENMGYHTQALNHHTHPWTLTAANSSALIAPPSMTFRIYKQVLGKMKDYNSAIESAIITSGVWTSPSLQINASTLGKLFWNENVETGDDIKVYFRAGSTQVLCEGEVWSIAIDNSNGSALYDYISANVWVQFKITFTAVNTTVSNPCVYFADGYIFEFFYSQKATLAETAVEFRYSLGYRNFDMPMVDKIHKKIGTAHEGSEGSFKVIWETENADDEFVISLTDYPEHWTSFFQSTAMGEMMNLEVYKNDLCEFKLKEINGIFSPEPLII